MDIYQVAQQLFTQDPRPPRSIQMEITGNTTAEIFEILAILLAESLKIKLPKHKLEVPDIVIVLKLKQYFQSINFDFRYRKVVDTNHLEHLQFKNYFVFQNNVFYDKLEFAIAFNIGDNLYMNYVPILHNSSKLENFLLYIKSNEDQIYEVIFKEYY